MNPEDLQALKELIEFLENKNIGEFRLERGELKVELRFAAAIAAAAPPPPSAFDPLLLARFLQATPAPSLVSAAPALAAEALAAPVTAVAPTAEEVLHTVKSPIVGTFYESPSPGSPAFVKVGDTIQAGQPLCIVEAMKLMNEIESDITGEIVKRLVENGHPVEYGQPLFAVRPR